MTTKHPPQKLNKTNYKRQQILEAKMASYLKDKGGMPTDEEIRELCMLRARYKKENE